MKQDFSFGKVILYVWCLNNLNLEIFKNID